MKIKYIRHSTMIIENNGKFLLIDPVFGNKETMEPIILTKNKDKNPKIELPFNFIDILNSIDAVLLSHIHSDHFDKEAQLKLNKNTKILCQPSDIKNLKKNGFKQVFGIDSNFEWEGIKIQRFSVNHTKNIILKFLIGNSSSYYLSEKNENLFYTGDSILDKNLLNIIKNINPSNIIANAGNAKMKFGSAITLDYKSLEIIKRQNPEIQISAIHMDAFNHCETKEQFNLENTKKIINVPFEGENIILKNHTTTAST